MGSFSTIGATKLLFEHTIDELARKFNQAEPAVAASYINQGDYIGLLISPIASIFDNANLSKAKLQSILDNTNLTIQKGQEIVDAMSSPSKIGTGGRRGIIGDDWEDNKITSRDNAATVATALDKIFQTFRPDWSTNGDVSVASGHVTLANTDAGLIISFDKVVSLAQLKLAFQDTSGNNRQEFRFMSDSNNIPNNSNNWQLRTTCAGDFDLYKYVSGSGTNVISSTWTANTAWHTIKATRDADGNWEIFFDGTSKGTAIDTWLPTINYLTISNHPVTNYEHYVDNLEVC